MKKNKFFKKTFEKRRLGFSLIFSMLVVLSQLIGYNIIHYDTFLPINIRQLILAILIFITVTFFLTFIINTIFILFDKMFKSQSVKKPTYKRLLLFWGIILISWIPYFLQYYPGLIQRDTLDQIAQALNISLLKDHHPVFYTGIIYVFFHLGTLINGTNELGVVLYTICQMLFLSFTYAYSAYFLQKHHVNKFLICFMVLFYALYPMHAMYSITMYKDVLFATCINWLVILILNLVLTPQKITQKRYLILMVLIGTAVSLLRQNGFYAILITMIILIIYYKSYRKNILFAFLSIFLIFIGYKNIIFPAINAQPTAIKEALAVPLQQLARVDSYKNLTSEESKQINNFFKRDNIGQLYTPQSADDVRQNLDQDYFHNHVKDFINIWATNALKYPVTYINAFLANNVGYYYAFAKERGMLIITNIEQTPITLLKAHNPNEKVVVISKDLGLETKPIKEFKIIKRIVNTINDRNLPIFLTIGFNFWLIILCLTYAIYKKNNSYFLAFLPVLSVWFTILASSVSGVFRFVYCIFTTLPIFIGILGLDKKEEKSGSFR